MLGLPLLELHSRSRSIFADLAVVERPATIPRKGECNLFLKRSRQEHIKKQCVFKC